MITPTEEIAIRPEDLKRLDHEHIDLTAPGKQKAKSIPTKQPDQSEFMESTIGTNARYKNIDDMGPISIPGDPQFGDSLLNLGQPEAPDAKKPAAEPSNPYEDLESKETPASEEDAEQIKNLYSAADQILNSAPGAESSEDDLDKHIDELLAFTRSLDQPGSKQQNNDDTDFMDNIEILPETPDETTTAQKTDSKEQRAHSTAFDADELEISPLPGTKAASSNNMLGSKDPEPHFAFEQKSETETTRNKKAEKQEKPKAQGTGDDFDDTQTSTETPPEEDDLPSLEQDIPPALRRSLERFEAPRRSPWINVALSFAMLLFVAGLLVQVVIFRSADLVRINPALQPMLMQACDVLPCVYSGPMDVSKISLTSRDVRSHPSQNNALLISAAFVNQARFDQPYPDILVRLSDISGNIVANRRFTPQEYLDKMYNPFLLMESGTPVHITLPVLDPGKDAINFEFTFL